jgi:hypothetical protein
MSSVSSENGKKRKRKSERKIKCQMRRVQILTSSLSDCMTWPNNFIFLSLSFLVLNKEMIFAACCTTFNEKTYERVCT